MNRPHFLPVLAATLLLSLAFAQTTNVPMDGSPTTLSPLLGTGQSYTDLVAVSIDPATGSEGDFFHLITTLTPFNWTEDPLVSCPGAGGSEVNNLDFDETFSTSFNLDNYRLITRAGQSVSAGPGSPVFEEITQYLVPLDEFDGSPGSWDIDVDGWDPSNGCRGDFYFTMTVVGNWITPTTVSSVPLTGVNTTIPAATSDLDLVRLDFTSTPTAATSAVSVGVDYWPLGSIIELSLDRGFFEQTIRYNEDGNSDGGSLLTCTTSGFDVSSDVSAIMWRPVSLGASQVAVTATESSPPNLQALDAGTETPVVLSLDPQEAYLLQIDIPGSAIPDTGSYDIEISLSSTNAAGLDMTFAPKQYDAFGLFCAGQAVLTPYTACQPGGACIIRHPGWSEAVVPRDEDTVLFAGVTNLGSTTEDFTVTARVLANPTAPVAATDADRVGFVSSDGADSRVDGYTIEDLFLAANLDSSVALAVTHSGLGAGDSLLVKVEVSSVVQDNDFNNYAVFASSSSTPTNAGFIVCSGDGGMEDDILGTNCGHGAFVNNGDDDVGTLPLFVHPCSSTSTLPSTSYVYVSGARTTGPYHSVISVSRVLVPNPTSLTAGTPVALSSAISVFSGPATSGGDHRHMLEIHDTGSIPLSIIDTDFSPPLDSNLFIGTAPPISQNGAEYYINWNDGDTHYADFDGSFDGGLYLVEFSLIFDHQNDPSSAEVRFDSVPYGESDGLSLCHNAGYASWPFEGASCGEGGTVLNVNETRYDITFISNLNSLNFDPQLYWADFNPVSVSLLNLTVTPLTGPSLYATGVPWGLNQFTCRETALRTENVAGNNVVSGLSDTAAELGPWSTTYGWGACPPPIASAWRWFVYDFSGNGGSVKLTSDAPTDSVLLTGPGTVTADVSDLTGLTVNVRIPAAARPSGAYITGLALTTGLRDGEAELNFEATFGSNANPEPDNLGTADGCPATENDFKYGFNTEPTDGASAFGLNSVLAASGTPALAASLPGPSLLFGLLSSDSQLLDSERSVYFEQCPGEDVIASYYITTEAEDAGPFPGVANVTFEIFFIDFDSLPVLSNGSDLVMPVSPSSDRMSAVEVTNPSSCGENYRVDLSVSGPDVSSVQGFQHLFHATAAHPSPMRVCKPSDRIAISRATSAALLYPQFIPGNYSSVPAYKVNSITNAADPDVFDYTTATNTYWFGFLKADAASASSLSGSLSIGGVGYDMCSPSSEIGGACGALLGDTGRAFDSRSYFTYFVDIILAQAGVDPTNMTEWSGISEYYAYSICPVNSFTCDGFGLPITELCQEDCNAYTDGVLTLLGNDGDAFGSLLIPDCSSAPLSGSADCAPGAIPLQIGCPADCTVTGCNSRGNCNTGTGVCSCDAGFNGDSCEFVDCGGGGDCNGRGTCNGADGSCSCDTGFNGDSCEFVDCPGGGNCNNQGSCNDGNGVCTCDSGFHGADCSLDDIDCPGAGDCGANGDCDVTTGNCVCGSTFYGDECEFASCPGDCNGAGICNNSTGVCDCDDGFDPPACTQDSGEEDEGEDDDNAAGSDDEGLFGLSSQNTVLAVGGLIAVAAVGFCLLTGGSGGGDATRSLSGSKSSAPLAHPPPSGEGVKFTPPPGL